MNSFQRVLNRYARQTMLYWQKNGSDQFGKPSYVSPSSPAVIKIRWEDFRQEIILPDKRKVLSHGFILTNTPVVSGSLIFLGTLLDWEATNSFPNPPAVNDGGREVLKVDGINDPKNLGTTYQVYI